MTTETVQDVATTAAWLATIGEQEFRDLVADDIRGKLDVEAAAGLRHPTVLIRWTRMLNVLLKDAHVQIQEKGHNLANRDWYVKVARWEVSIRARQAEARALVQRFEHEAQHAESLRARRARGEAREAAIARLIDAHLTEFRQIIAEERELAGMPQQIRPGA